MKTLNLKILDVNIRVRSEDSYALGLLSQGYDAFISDESPHPDMDYHISSHAKGRKQLIFNGNETIDAINDYELIYFFEKSMTIELQKQRQDLLFLHGGALEYNGKSCLFVAPSGSGKSTTTWAALHHGFNYLSDELAPIHPDSNLVECYPHALCLKQVPPEPYALPEGVISTSLTKHVPASALPCKAIMQPVPLAAIFLVRYDPSASQPSITPISTAQCGAHIYHNALNLLAHSRYGLDAAVKVAAACKAYELITNDLAASVELVKDTLEGL